MGGGSSYSGPSPRSTDEAEKIFKSAVEEVDQGKPKTPSEEQKAAYQAYLNSYFQDLLSDFNNRDVDQINTHLETIKDALGKESIGSINLIYGGSIKKHTYVDGLSDVDILATIDNTTLADASPHQVLEYFANRLRERLPNTEIKIGTLAVTVKFSDGHEIQVLPAISTTTGMRISNVDGTNWSAVIRPDKFAGKLTNVNQSNSGKVVPVIKLSKAINARLPKDAQLSGYHIESLAINAFENYQGNLSYGNMLLHLAEYASKAVLNPIRDSTGQSIHVDDYLGSPESSDRRRASVALESVAARMRLADLEASLERWKELVEE
jgi:hypothetical protein